MDEATLSHLNIMVGEVKLLIGYIQFQLDSLYTKIQNNLNPSAYIRVVPFISWQQRNTNDDSMPITRQAELLYFKQFKK